MRNLPWQGNPKSGRLHCIDRIHTGIEASFLVDHVHAPSPHPESQMYPMEDACATSCSLPRACTAFPPRLLGTPHATPYSFPNYKFQFKHPHSQFSTHLQYTNHHPLSPRNLQFWHWALDHLFVAENSLCGLERVGYGDWRGGGERREANCACIDIEFLSMEPHFQTGHYWFRETPPYSCQVSLGSVMVKLDVILMQSEFCFWVSDCNHWVAHFSHDQERVLSWSLFILESTIFPSFLCTNSCSFLMIRCMF